MPRNNNNRQNKDHKIKPKVKAALDTESSEHKALNILADIALVELLKIYPAGKVTKK